MIRRLVLLLALLGAFGTVVTGAPADAAAPAVGSCHRLTEADATNEYTDTSAPVPCGTPHTLQTIAVVTGPSLAGLTQAQIGALSARSCGQADKLLGNPLQYAQTAYAEFTFAPSAAQIAAGESWFRCDIGLVRGTQLQRLPKHLTKPLVSRTLTDAVRLCLAGRAETTCNHPHTERSIGALRAPEKPFPSKSAFTRFAHQRCPGATDYIVSDSAAYRHGRGVIVCFQKTRR